MNGNKNMPPLVAGWHTGPLDALKPMLERSTRLLARIGACGVGGFLLASPLSFQQALEETRIVDTVAGSPVVLEYTHHNGSQIDLGPLGRIYAPSAERYGIGMSAEFKDIPFSKQGSYFSFLASGNLAQLAGVYSHPQEAMQGSVSALNHELRHNFKSNELRNGTLMTGGLLLGSLLYKRERGKLSLKHARLLGAGSLAAAATASLLYPAYSFSEWEGNNPPVSNIRLPITKLQDTQFADISVSNWGLQYAIDEGVDKINTLLRRQAERQEQFITTASTDLANNIPNIHPPEPNETMILLSSDIHDNEAMTEIMTQTVALINEQFGEDTLKLHISAGDMTYGSSPEEYYVKQQAKIAPEQVVADGNHHTTVTQQQIDDAGMERLTGEVIEKEGITILGDEDPLVTPFGGQTTVRHPDDEKKDVQAELGTRLYEQSGEGEANVVVVHEGYAAGAYLGLEDATKSSLTTWFENRGSNSIPWDDGVRDLPASMLVYGHWHRIIEPRTVWNDDGTWTLVMELNTSGGAIGDPTLNHFSTPNNAPGQVASYPIVYIDNETKLVTGYHMFTYDTDGNLNLSYTPIGIPEVLSSNEEINADRHKQTRNDTAAGSKSE